MYVCIMPSEERDYIAHKINDDNTAATAEIRRRWQR